MTPAGVTPPDRPSLTEALAAGESLLLPGVWDPLSALSVAAAGFPFAFVSGFAVAGAHLGVPDIGLLTQTEVAEVARRISLAVPGLGLVVDADTGYGAAANVVRTVGLWEQAGAVGLFLEDQVWPKRCGHMPGKEVVDRADWAAKLGAALRARTRLHVTARTDARAVLGLPEALERGRMARDLGVDAVFVEAPESIAELEQIAAALPDVVLVANMVEHGRTPLLSAAELTELGFRLVLSPLSALLTVAAALESAACVLRTEGTARDHLDTMLPFDRFTDLVGIERFRTIEQQARH